MSAVGAALWQLTPVAPNELQASINNLRSLRRAEDINGAQQKRFH